MATILFPEVKQNPLFTWDDVRTFFVRTQYNELLNQVLDKDKDFIVDGIPNADGKYLTRSGGVPQNYYNPELTLAFVRGTCNIGPIFLKEKATTAVTGLKTDDSKKEKSTEKVSTVQPGILAANTDFDPCREDDNDDLVRVPSFLYDRFNKKITIPNPTPGGPAIEIDSNLKLDTQLNFGAVLWLYYYDRMGIFDILKALMNDYNFAGKLPISSKAENTTTEATLQYSSLMDTISTLYRIGIGSNSIDRKTLYQRVLGVSLNGENGTAVVSEKNESFMRNFNKLVGYMIDFFRDKQLAQAIRDTNTNTIRSSVATQTAIRDTIQVLQKNFEVFDYGRNRTNTFLGIATVYATVCLLRMLKDEIGVPRQFNEPHEFIPAAYDILVAKRPVTSSENNRFTIFDNCASYGYRLLTDIEFIEPNILTTAAVGSVLDAWLNDIEGVVEGYNNAYKSLGEMKTEREMVMA
jgi:hypothetical protein